MFWLCKKERATEALRRGTLATTIDSTRLGNKEMKKILLAGLTAGILMFGSVAWAENEATYNASTGVLNIPKVDVGSTYYNVTMQQQGQGLDFGVIGAGLSLSSSSLNVATYIPGSLHIPTVIVGSDSYTVDLAQGEGSNFSVTGAVLQIKTSYSPVITVPTTDVDGSYTVSWGASATEGVSYTLEEATNSTFGAGLQTAYAGAALSTSISGRTTGTTYYYRVKVTKTGYTDSTWTVGANGCFVDIPIVVNRLPDTGQTQSYTNTFGEDSDYSINPLSYTDNGNGTVSDNITGLVWQQQGDGQAMNWAAAGNYCASLPLAGGGWRLPSKKELGGIVDYSIFHPAINSVFTGTQPGEYWSLTTSRYPNSALYVSFDHGMILDVDKSANLINVRCVRGDQEPVNNYTADNGTITDNNTGLDWQQQDDGQVKTWEEAISYCEGLSLAGQNDWRLPNAKELYSITDYILSDPDSTFIAPIFSSSVASSWLPSSPYWTSTTYAISDTKEKIAWYVDFYNSSASFSYKFNYHYVRCVRGGQ